MGVVRLCLPVHVARWDEEVSHGAVVVGGGGELDEVVMGG